MTIFHPVREAQVTRAIIESYLKQFTEYVESDVIIVGAGPSGMVAGRELARKGLKTVIIERNNYLGGGFWVGGYFMNKLTLRAPSQEYLDGLGVPYARAAEGLYVADAHHACASLISAACQAGVKFFSLTYLEDVVIRQDNRVSGVVINWSPIAHLPREIAALDPVPLETGVVIDATGHDACVLKKLEKRGLIKLSVEGALWINKSEDAVVQNTREIYPGLIVAGMAVASFYGLPRMGPTFGGMLLSGQQAAKVALGVLERK